MTRIVAFMCLALAVSYMPVLADETREVFEIEIDAGVDAVWEAFTTTPGIKSWVAPLAEIDFRVGGKWRANSPAGQSRY